MICPSPSGRRSSLPSSRTHPELFKEATCSISADVGRPIPLPVAAPEQRRSVSSEAAILVVNDGWRVGFAVKLARIACATVGLLGVTGCALVAGLEDRSLEDAGYAGATGVDAGNDG